MKGFTMLRLMPSPLKRPQFHFLTLFYLLTNLGNATCAQELTQDRGLWAPITLKSPVYKKVEASLEVQPRWQSTAENGISENIIRAGLGFRLTKNVSIFGGYYWSSKFEEELDWENRLWQQITYSKKFARFSLQNRTRLEEIAQEEPLGAAWRVRHQIRFSYDLPKTKWYVVVAEEPFFYLNGQENGPRQGFNQNRVTLAVGRKINRCVRTECGYINQYKNNRGSPDLVNHILLTQVSIDLDNFFSQKKFKLAHNHHLKAAAP
ncbi:MAG TPA: DUF2490 domain-containing protein [Candidatus Obscuribacterales bacterium]